jgi:16S rRNA (guanine966-N2)-methyltransferase
MLKNQVRIIGGKWRGRKLKFPDVEGLRPTADRVRETLFNWLAPVIVGARCLDLFAGSGALGFEALSRGAREVFFVDQHRKIIRNLKENAEKLDCEHNTKIIYAKAEDHLETIDSPFDVIFLDPPFHQNIIVPMIKKIEKCNAIKPGGYIYIETESDAPELALPKNWQIKKQKRAGNVRFCLIGVD